MLRHRAWFTSLVYILSGIKMNQVDYNWKIGFVSCRYYGLHIGLLQAERKGAACRCALWWALINRPQNGRALVMLTGKIAQPVIHLVNILVERLADQLIQGIQGCDNPGSIGG